MTDPPGHGYTLVHHHEDDVLGTSAEARFEVRRAEAERQLARELKREGVAAELGPTFKAEMLWKNEQGRLKSSHTTLSFT